MPPALKAACTPLLEQIAQINQTIAAMDKQIHQLEKKYPEIALLRTAPGVGPVVAACYVLTLDSPQAMETNRQAGAFLGLRPGAATVWRLQPATRHHQDRQHLPAQSTGAVGAVHLGPLGPQTRSCAAGDSSLLPAVANGARSAPSLPWLASWPSSCSACGATARNLNPSLNRRPS